METVIAKTKKSYLVCYIVILVCGVIMLLIGGLYLMLDLASDEFQFGVIFICIGVVFLGIGIFGTVWMARLPKNYITFKDGKFYFWKGLVCSPSEVDYCNCKGNGVDGAMFNFGRLIVSVGGTVYKMNFVEDANNVCAKINALKAQTMAVEEIQKHIADKKAEETAAETTPNEENQG